MARMPIDVLTIGNAIVDVLARVDEAFLEKNELVKASMRLIDEPEAHRLYELVGPSVIISGGSAANTAAGISSLGGRAAFIGKVRDDQLGEFFTHDIRATGVIFEGQLWDPPAAKDAFVKAAQLARKAGRKVALTLSDSFCVERHRSSFRELIARDIDILFANERELASLYETSFFDEALQRVRKEVELAVLTRSEAGSVVAFKDEFHVVEAKKVANLVDATGAGDLYASGFLFGLTRGLPLVECARLGSLAAAEVISHIGARPQTSLKALAEAAGFG
jgi:sugar/nucleoside kinase (ribokinase family)